MSRLLIFTFVLATSLAASLHLTGCAPEEPPPLRLSVDTSEVQTQEIARVLDEADELDTLVAHLERARLLDELRRDGPFTVFAPTNAAFAAVPLPLDSLLRTRSDSSRTMLRHHIARGRYDSTRVRQDSLRVSSLAHEPLTLRSAGESVFYVDSIVVRRTIHAGNGVVHVIDRVLDLPLPDSVQTPRLARTTQ